MDWNENDYHCRQSGVRTQGPDTAVRPVSLAAGRSKPLNESPNESDGISPESGQVDALNESTVLRHRFLDALGESTNSPVATFAQGGREQPVRRDCERTAVAPDLLLHCPRSHPPRRAARRAGSAAVKCTTIAQCTGQIRPAGFFSGHSSRRRLSLFQVECTRITFRGWYLCKYIDARTDATQSPPAPTRILANVQRIFRSRIRLSCRVTRRSGPRIAFARS
jgi:hypothetical protein